MKKIELNAMISNRISALILQTENLITLMKSTDYQIRQNSEVIYMTELNLCESEFYEVRTNALSLLGFIPDNRNFLISLSSEIANLKNTISGTETLLGYLRGLKSDFDGGFLTRFSDYIVAEIEGDYFTQAENLLSPNEEYNHIPAAVLLGAVLEDSLRHLCENQSPQIETIKPNGDFKMLNALIDELKKAGVFNELKAKQLRAWADIRNYAAHGRFNEFTRNDVEEMLSGVRNFLADYMGK